MEIGGPNGQLWDVGVAGSLLHRWLGLMGQVPRPLLLATDRVHGFWLRAPIRLVGLDGDGEVIEVRILSRRRLAHVRGATWILELPLDAPCPAPGDRLTAPVFSRRLGGRAHIRS